MDSLTFALAIYFINGVTIGALFTKLIYRMKRQESLPNWIFQSVQFAINALSIYLAFRFFIFLVSIETITVTIKKHEISKPQIERIPAAKPTGAENENANN